MRGKITILVLLVFICGGLYSIGKDYNAEKALPTVMSLASPTDVAAVATDAAPAATNTPAPPTATATITNTPLPSATSTQTATATATSTPRPPNRITFSSQQNGQQPVIGPIDIPSGLYKVTATTNGYLIGDIEVTSGECITTGLTFFNLSEYEAKDGAETVVGSINCRAIITITNTQAAWTLEFVEVVLPDAVTTIQRSYSSSANGVQAAIGPVTFPDGRYRVTATTGGYIIADIEVIAGKCETGIFGLFNASEGEATSGAESLLTTRGCTGFLLVYNTQQPWTLEFEKLE